MDAIYRSEDSLLDRRILVWGLNFKDHSVPAHNVFEIF